MKNADYCWNHSWGHLRKVPFYKNATLQFAFTVAIAVSFFIYQEWKQQEARAKSTLSGRLTPVEDRPAQHALDLVFGGNRVTVGKVTGEGRIPIIGLFGAIDLAYKDGSVLVSAEVVSPDGQIVARIEDNEWHVNPNNYFDRNYDRSALEVFDAQRGVVVLQVEFLDKATIRLAGLFGDGDRYTCVVDSGAYGIPNRSEMEKLASKTTSSLKSLKRIFRYPSGLHLGERVQKEVQQVRIRRSVAIMRTNCLLTLDGPRLSPGGILNVAGSQLPIPDASACRLRALLFVWA